MFLCDNQYFNFGTNLLENGNLFQKKLEYRVLVESTKIEDASFPYINAISQTNVRQIERLAQNGPTTKNGVLLVTNLLF